MRRLMIAALALFAITATGHAKAEPDQNDPSARESFPRFARLKFDNVRARGGAGDGFPVLWRYKRLNLPVYVLEPSGDWRLVRDAWGDQAWVHRRMIEDNRGALVMPNDARGAILRKSPGAEGRAIARLAPGVVARIGYCQANWCEITVAKYKGWVERPAIWGDSPDDAVPRLTSDRGTGIFASSAPVGTGSGVSGANGNGLTGNVRLSSFAPRP